MIDHDRFALNRIACPSLGLDAFYALAKKAGLRKVELRNDIRDGQVIDGMKPREAAALAKDRGIGVVTINAVQKFNLPSMRAKAKNDLQQLLEIAKEIGCPAIVMCPNNDAADKRPADAKLADTAESLREFGPLFAKAGIVGYIEPLGFGISSLASVDVAREAIAKSGQDCYRVLVDSFHKYLGPDEMSVLEKAGKAGAVGFMHISGIDSAVPKADIRDAHRVMPGAKDIMKSKETMKALLAAGYKGDIGFEPFSEEVQKLSPDALVAALKASIDWLSA